MLQRISPPEDNILMSLCFVPNSTGKIRYQLDNKKLMTISSPRRFVIAAQVNPFNTLNN